MQKKENISLENLRALVRLKSQTVFLIEMIVDMGFRSFKVHLEDGGISVLRSKIVQGPVMQASTQKTSIGVDS